MLVLSRDVGERIVIGDDVVITVLLVSGDTVRLGIEAPREIVVDRAEVADARASSARIRAGADESVPPRGDVGPRGG